MTIPTTVSKHIEGELARKLKRVREYFQLFVTIAHGDL